MIEFSRRQMILSAAALAAFAKGGGALAFGQAAAAAAGGGGAAWDLTDLYPSDAAWEAERQAIAAQIPSLLKHKGTLGESAAALKAALQAASDAYRKTVRLYIYASLKADEDVRVAANQERRQQAQDVFTQLGEALAWTSPEILSVGKPKVDAFLAQDPGLGKFRFQLHDMLRQAPHTLTEEAEKVIAGTGAPLAGPSDIRDQLASADIPRPEVTLSDGRKVRLDDQGYTLNRAVPNRADRKLVFDSFWASYGKFEGSLGAALAAKIKGDMFASKARKYKNSLEWALSGSNIPEGVYRTLVAETNRGLPQLHRYFELRRRMLGLPDIHYYDIYPPLVSLDRKFPLAEMRAITLDALKPLGPEYGRMLARGTAANWSDPLPRQGKASGAYMSGSAYDVHPYLLLNLGEDYEGLTTYAHEWGHAVHSLLSKEAQPWETFDYATFTAEIASTVNEQLLVRHLLKGAKTKQEKLFYLGQQMEQFRGTFFRQTMFAEFELAVHDRAEAGEGLSGEKFTALYLDLLKRYHGPGMTIDPAYAIEWAYIPHFFRTFYVFQYATSVSGAVYFSQKVLAGSTAARDALLGVLKAGGSDYPTEILRKAGLDMTTPAPYQALVTEFGRVMDEAEALL
jgi:oligoendopeptidase F